MRRYERSDSGMGHPGCQLARIRAARAASIGLVVARYRARTELAAECVLLTGGCVLVTRERALLVGGDALLVGDRVLPADAAWDCRMGAWVGTGPERTAFEAPVRTAGGLT